MPARKPAQKTTIETTPRISDQVALPFVRCGTP
jgi:hypothetical protein